MFREDATTEFEEDGRQKQLASQLAKEVPPLIMKDENLEDFHHVFVSTKIQNSLK